LLPLPKDLLYIAKAHSEHHRQLPEAAMTVCMRFE
jgi:hypothetical protein